METPLAHASGNALVAVRMPNRLAASPALAAKAGRGADTAAAPWPALLGEPPLSAAEQGALEQIAQTRSVLRGESVIDRSRQATALVVLAQGEVALGLRTADGTFHTERIVRGPAWLDQSSAWLGAAHAMDAQALGPSRVIELPCAALAKGLVLHPGLSTRLIRGLASEIQTLAVNTHELMHKDAPARLAQWLSQRCQPVAGDEAQAVVKLNERKRDVASQLAITPETLSRLMRSFTRQGVIEVSGYLVRVLDVAALGRLAEA